MAGSGRETVSGRAVSLTFRADGVNGLANGGRLVADQKSSPPDPFTAWRDWLSQAERQLNSFFNDMMGSEQYTRSMGQFNNFTMNMQKSMNEAIARHFSSLNLPTSQDIAMLTHRLAAIEDRLAAIERETGDVIAANMVNHREAGAATPRPPRTRKAPTAKAGE